MSHLEVPAVIAFAASELPGFKQPMKEPQAFFIQGWLLASHFQEIRREADTEVSRPAGASVSPALLTTAWFFT